VNSNTTYDCIVVGGGPAGLVTAVYLQRFRRKVLLIDNGNSRLRNVPQIKNLVGYAEGISGKSLLHRLRLQALKYKTEIINGEATIRRHNREFEVDVNGQSFFSKNAVIATGIKDKQPKNVDYADLCQKGVLAYCPICDGFDHRGETVGVVIDSSAGFHKIKFLYNFTNRLQVILIRDIDIPARHLEKISKFGVKVHKGELEKMLQHPERKTLIVKLKGQRPFEVKMAYVALGICSATKTFRHLNGLRKTKPGLLYVNSHQETSIQGLYAVGDCVKGLAQVSVAVGQAAIAATAIHNSLSASSLFPLRNRHRDARSDYRVLHSSQQFF
jgi:thioredoxin reductase (NADPH)